MRNLIIKTSRGEYYPVKIDDILFLEILKGRTKIYLNKGELQVNNSIHYVIEQLGKQFVQCHRKYAVNIEKVTSFNKSELKIDQTIISLGPKYKQTFFESMLAKRTLI
jgi:DNA-binding LytR/AlgR family response regulator